MPKQIKKEGSYDETLCTIIGKITNFAEIKRYTETLTVPQSDDKDELLS